MTKSFLWDYIKPHQIQSKLSSCNMLLLSYVTILIQLNLGLIRFSRIISNMCNCSIELCILPQFIYSRLTQFCIGSVFQKLTVKGTPKQVLTVLVKGCQIWLISHVWVWSRTVMEINWERKIAFLLKLAQPQTLIQINLFL